MVWFGAVSLAGIVWFAMVWFGVEQNALSCMLVLAIVWFGLLWFGIVLYKRVGPVC